MERKRVSIDPKLFPSSVNRLLSGVPVYDSSCSDAARVWFIDRDGGYYLKSAPAGSLKEEAAMTGFLHQKGLAPEVAHYEQSDADWLLTRRIPGEDCLSKQYLDDPNRLCDTLANLLRMLHETDVSGCPISNRTDIYISTAIKNYRLGKWHPSRFPDGQQLSCPEDAWAVVQEFSGALKADTLIHGDFCLPNVMLDNWTFSGFIDLGSSGMGDRHMDLFWGCWSLRYNLKTDAYRGRFLDVYGRDHFDPDILRAIAAFEAFG